MRERFVPSVLGKAAGLVAFAFIRKEWKYSKKYSKEDDDEAWRFV